MRLTNRPCATCKVDTLHTGPTCRTCGTIAVLADVTLQKRFASVMLAERSGHRTRHNRAKRRAAKSQIGPLREAPTTRGPFGSGRARTKC